MKQQKSATQGRTFTAMVSKTSNKGIYLPLISSISHFHH